MNPVLLKKHGSSSHAWFGTLHPQLSLMHYFTLPPLCIKQSPHLTGIYPGEMWYTASDAIIFSILIGIKQTCLKRPLSKRIKIGFQGQLSRNAGQKYYRMLQGEGEHSVILLTFINLPFIIKIFVLSIFEWPFKTGFTVVSLCEPTNGVLVYCVCNQRRL